MVYAQVRHAVLSGDIDSVLRKSFAAITQYPIGYLNAPDRIIQKFDGMIRFFHTPIPGAYVIGAVSDSQQRTHELLSECEVPGIETTFMEDGINYRTQLQEEYERMRRP